MSRQTTTKATKTRTESATPPSEAAADAAAKAAADAAKFEGAPPSALAGDGAEGEQVIAMTPSALQDVVSAAVVAALAAVPTGQTTIVSPGSLPSVPEPTKEMLEAAAARDRLVKSLISDRTHMEHCPVLVTGEGRTEFYAAMRPANPGKAEPERALTIVRCIECGGTQTLEGAPEAHGL